MSKTARDYRVTFGYMAVDGVYYVPGRPHRGNDRPTPDWTPIVIGNTTIGYTGATGLVSGAHIHTQAGRDKWCQDTVNPTPYEFKGGKVVHTGWANQWGNHIIMKVGKHYICYAHLARISVKIGQVIKEEEMVNKSQVNHIVRFYQGKPPTRNNLRNWVGKKSWDEVVKIVRDSHVTKDRINKAKAGKLKAVNHLPIAVRKVYKEPTAKVKATKLKSGLYEVQ